MTTPRASEAYAAWYHAKREFDAALPWTADWLRLRLVEHELRSEWERLALDDDALAADGVGPGAGHATVSSAGDGGTKA
jgi:hypothetical protein